MRNGAFETAMFSFRSLVLIAVLGALASSVAMFVKGCIEVIQGIITFRIGFGFQPISLDDKNVIVSFIPAVDDYLFATILLIISMGFYVLFITKINPASLKEHMCPNWFVANDHGDLA